MGVLKYKMPDGWKILYQDFFQKVVGFCKQMVRKDQNLADLDNLVEARANLGLSGDSNDTHYHDNHHLVINKNLADVADKAAARENLGLDSTYLKKSGDTMTGALKFANNTWNPVGDDAYIGDKNIGGKFAVKSQVSTKQTGIAFVAADSDDNSNYASLNYTGTKFEATKPFYATQGFYHDYVDTNQLDDYQTNNFIYGGVKAWDKNPIDGGFTVGNDYAGICFGYTPENVENGMAIGQLIFDGMALYFRSYDNSWANWEKIAYKSYVDTKDTATLTSAKSYTDSALGNYAKKDASNITVANWASKLGVGKVANGNTGLVTGDKVYDYVASAIDAAKTSLQTTISSATATASNGTQFNSATKANGEKNSYVKFNNGLMIAWGTSYKNGPCVVTFPQPFKQTPAVVIQEVSDHCRSWAMNVPSDTPEKITSTTGFKGWMECNNNDGDYFHWHALGKWK